MKCPECGSIDVQTKDSRPCLDDESTRRRLECSDCEHRFTSYEFLAPEVDDITITMVAGANSNSFKFDKVSTRAFMRTEDVHNAIENLKFDLGLKK